MIKFTPALISGIFSTASLSASTASNWSRSVYHPASIAFVQQIRSKKTGTHHQKQKARAKAAATREAMKRSGKSPTDKNKKQKQLTGFFRASSALTATTDSDASSSSQYKIFCDLDGVLVDFDHGVRTLLDGKGPDDVPPSLMWGRIAQCDFYTHLPWMDDAKSLWNELKSLPNVDILTGVPRYKRSKGEKFEWCRRELGVEVNHVDMAGSKSAHQIVSGSRRRGVVNVITCWSKNKHFESRENHVLIDDRLTLKKEWEKRGGMFIHHTTAEQTISILRECGILSNENALESSGSDSTTKSEVDSACTDSSKSN